MEQRLRKLLNRCLRRWPWFVVAIAVCLYGAYLYTKSRPQEFVSTASIRLGDGQPASASFLPDVGLSSTVNLTNEVQTLRGLELMQEVARCCFDSIGQNMSAQAIRARLKVEQRHRSASIVDLTYTDTDPLRAQNVLKTLIEAYENQKINERQRILATANDFLARRIEVLQAELAAIDVDIANYKSDNLVLDAEKYGAMATASAIEAQKHIDDIAHQIELVTYVRRYVIDRDHKLLPTVSGIDNVPIQQMMASYNEVMTRYNSKLAHSSEQNPLVMDLEEELESLRQSIDESLNNEISRLQLQREKETMALEVAQSRISESPIQSQYLLSVGREQKVKENLFLYLLQKKEENQLTDALTGPHAVVIEPPSIGIDKMQSQRWSIWALAMAIGLILPTLAVYIELLFDSTIQGIYDLEGHGFTVLGEISAELEEEELKLLAHDLKLFMNRTVKGKAIMITSAEESEMPENLKIRLALALESIGTDTEVVPSGTVQRYRIVLQKGLVLYSADNADTRVDAALTAQFVHATIFIIAEGKMPRAMLDKIAGWIALGRFPNVALVVIKRGTFKFRIWPFAFK